MKTALQDSCYFSAVSCEQEEVSWWWSMFLRCRLEVDSSVWRPGHSWRQHVGGGRQLRTERTPPARCSPADEHLLIKQILKHQTHSRTQCSASVVSSSNGYRYRKPMHPWVCGLNMRWCIVGSRQRWSRENLCLRRASLVCVNSTDMFRLHCQ